jgi:hypothetical protein
MILGRLGGVVVSVLATGTKSCGFKTRPTRWIFYFQASSLTATRKVTSSAESYTARLEMRYVNVNKPGIIQNYRLM